MCILCRLVLMTVRANGSAQNTPRTTKVYPPPRSASQVAQTDSEPPASLICPVPRFAPTLLLARQAAIQAAILAVTSGREQRRSASLRGKPEIEAFSLKRTSKGKAGDWLG